jgi:hypothetical protein
MLSGELTIRSAAFTTEPSIINAEKRQMWTTAAVAAAGLIRGIAVLPLCDGNTGCSVDSSIERQPTDFFYSDIGGVARAMLRDISPKGAYELEAYAAAPGL